MPSIQSSLIKIIFSDELENLVVQIQAITGESEDILGELRSVRVRVWGGRALRWRRLVLTGRRRDGRLHPELAFPAAALGGDVLRSGEGERAKGEDWRRRKAVEAVVVGFR